MVIYFSSNWDFLLIDKSWEEGVDCSLGKGELKGKVKETLIKFSCIYRFEGKYKENFTIPSTKHAFYPEIFAFSGNFRIIGIKFIFYEKNIYNAISNTFYR